MKPCRLCNQPWDSSESRFTVCPTCRAKMPVRRVNMEPLNRRWRPLREEGGWKTGDGYFPSTEAYRISFSGTTWTDYKG